MYELVNMYYGDNYIFRNIVRMYRGEFDNFSDYQIGIIYEDLVKTKSKDKKNWEDHINIWFDKTLIRRNKKRIERERRE